MGVEKECNEMLKRFYGVDGLWTEMAEKCDLCKMGRVRDAACKTLLKTV